MNDLEEQLRRALARREPSADFTQRVLNAAVIEQPRERRWNRWFRSKWDATLRFAPVMVALVLAAGGAFYQQHERLEQGVAAKQQLLIAMRIAGEKLHSAQQQVVSIGADERIN